MCGFPVPLLQGVTERERERASDDDVDERRRRRAERASDRLTQRGIKREREQASQRERERELPDLSGSLSCVCALRREREVGKECGERRTGCFGLACFL